jgi:GTP pyrophosphokinase
LGSRGVEAVAEDAEKWLSEEFHVETLEDLLLSIGADDTRPHAVAVKLIEYWQQCETKENKENKENEDDEELLRSLITATRQTPSARLQVEGVSGLLTKLANCCYPLPGDNIVGFISRGKGVMVHREDCQNLTRYRKHDSERLVHVNWLSMSQPSYLAPIVISASDRAGLIRDIAAAVSDVGINLMALNSHVNGNRERVVITATLEVESLESLRRLFVRLEKIKNVMSVERDLGKKKS